MIWLVAGFVAGYLTCWYFKLRPFARFVEEQAADMQNSLRIWKTRQVESRKRTDEALRRADEVMSRVSNQERERP